jgi:hypothetical protein
MRWPVLGAAVFALDRNSRILFSNSEVDRLLGDGVVGADGVLSASFASDRAKLTAAIDTCCHFHRFEE